MEPSPTRYTRRCSCVMRLDQQPARRYLSGSGLPGPWKGSRITASTRSNTLIAAFRSDLTQYRRSSRNSGWKTAARLASRRTEHLSPQLSYADRLCGPAPLRPAKGRQQTARVPWRPQQVRGLYEPRELAGRNEGDITRASAPDNNRFLLVYNLIQNTCQVLTEAGIRRFNRHEPLELREDGVQSAPCGFLPPPPPMQG